MLVEATIATNNGHVNGYLSGGFDAEGVISQDAEQTAPSPIFQPALNQETSAPVVQLSSEITAPQESRTNTAEAEKPEIKKLVEKSPPRAKARSSKTAAQKTPPISGLKYVPQSALDRDLAKLETLSRAARDGDTTALDELRVTLDRCPHIWRRLADLEHLVELKLIALVAGNDPLRSEAFRKRCSELRHHLLGGEPSSLATKMAASRLTITWLFVQFLELRALESPEGLHSIKQLEQAERRYQVAMRTFAMARQLDAQLRRLAQLNN